MQTNVGQAFDMEAYLETMRREALSRELEMERTGGRHGLGVWGSMLVASALVLALTWRGLRGSQAGAV